MRGVPGRSDMRRPRPVFLEEPDVEVFRTDSGETEGVLVYLRPRGVGGRYALRPNPGVFVDVMMDREDLPVCINLQESIAGADLVRTVEGILRGMRRPGSRGAARTGDEAAAHLLRGLFRGLAVFRPAPPSLPSPALL